MDFINHPGAELIDELNVEEREEEDGFFDINEDHTIRDLEAVLSSPSTTMTTSSSTLVSTSATSIQVYICTPPVPEPVLLTRDPSQSPTAVSHVHLEPGDAGQMIMRW